MIMSAILLPDVLTRKCKLHTGHPELVVKGKKVNILDL